MGYENCVFPKESVFLVTGGAGCSGTEDRVGFVRLGYRVW